jgi:hypothetical protein
MSRISYSRRSLLQALAASAVTLPFARMLRASPGAPPPKRLVLLMQNNGTQQANFWPDANLSSHILDSLFTDPKTGLDNGLKKKTNIIKGMYVPNNANGTTGNEHDQGFACMFTGEKLMADATRAPWGGGPSVDQILAKAWGIESLTLAVLASQVESHPKPGFDHRQSFCYFGPKTIKPPSIDPLSVFNYLFPTNSPGDPSTARRLSVLDAVAANLGEISARLGPAERHKLDYHLTAIQDVESQLRRVPQCTGLTPPKNYLAIDPNSEWNEDTYITQMVDNMIDLAVLALKCGSTRIATMQFGYGGGKWRFAWKGINMNCHDDVAHHDTSDAGSSPENTARVVAMNQYYASCVARLATQLDAIPEGSGTMLDNTLVVWVNEMGRGDHNQENIPVVLIGKAGGAIPNGGRLISVGRQVFNRLGCTVLSAMGTSVAGFGDVPDCGVFQGLF